MLHLDAGVHLDEEPFLRIDVVEELDRARVVVADLLRERDRGLAEFVAHLLVEVHRGGDLDHLLVAPLHRTIALVEVDDVAVLVTEDLHLDVFGAPDEALEEHRRIAEGVFRLRLGLVEEAVELGLLLHDPHAASAATEGRLDDEGKADLACDLHRLGPVRDRFLGAGQGGDVHLLGESPGRDLVAHRVEHLGIGPDEGDAGLAAGAGEVRILREEPVARVDQGDPLVLGEMDDALDVEVGPDRTLSLRRR